MLSSRCGEYRAAVMPLAIISAAPTVGTRVLTPGHVVDPSKTTVAYAIAAIPTHPAIARSRPGSWPTREAERASRAPIPSSQMRVVETKNAVPGLLWDWATDHANDATVTNPSTPNAPSLQRLAATTATTTISSGQTR